MITGCGLIDFCFVLFSCVLISRLSYDSYREKTLIHVEYFHKLGIITEPRIFMTHTVVLGFITEKKRNTHD